MGKGLTVVLIERKEQYSTLNPLTLPRCGMGGGLRRTMNFAPAQYANILFMLDGIKQTTAPTAVQKWTEVTRMAEHIACRRCDSPDCKGCNLKRLETMLENGAFDCLMNENRCINISADVEPVKRGRWLPQILLGTRVWDCSECKTIGSPEWKRCPVCEAKMNEEAKHER